MDNQKLYTENQIKGIKRKINKVKDESVLVEILRVINDDPNNKRIFKNNDGVYMMFHNLTPNTYTKINKIADNHKIKEVNNIKTEFSIYSNDEFPLQDGISSKLKLSNREKNILKRKKYDKEINKNNDDDVIYSDFDVNNLTDSEKCETTLFA